MGRASMCGMTRVSMRGSGSRTRSMGMECTRGQMGGGTRVHGWTTICMGMGCTLGRTGGGMRESI